MKANFTNKITRPSLPDVLMWNRTQELHAALASKSLLLLYAEQTGSYILILTIDSYADTP